MTTIALEQNITKSLVGNGYCCTQHPTNIIANSYIQQRTTNSFSYSATFSGFFDLITSKSTEIRKSERLNVLGLFESEITFNKSEEMCAERSMKKYAIDKKRNFLDYYVG